MHAQNHGVMRGARKREREREVFFTERGGITSDIAHLICQLAQLAEGTALVIAATGLLTGGALGATLLNHSDCRNYTCARQQLQNTQRMQVTQRTGLWITLQSPRICLCPCSAAGLSAIAELGGLGQMVSAVIAKTYSWLCLE